LRRVAATDLPETLAPASLRRRCSRRAMTYGASKKKTDKRKA
jgi:hypothetical protein